MSIPVDPSALQTAHDVAQNLLVRKWSTLASLSILLYEHAITLNDELRFIWRRPKTLVRFIYIFSRYVAIFAQILNVYLIFGPLSLPNIQEATCKKWFGFQIFVACALMEALNVILMMRVYALHYKRWTVGLPLLSLFAGQVIIVIMFAPKSVYNISYNRVCDTTYTHPSFMLFAISVGVTHFTMALLTAARMDLRRMGLPVVRVVTRDGAWTLVIVCSLFAAIVPYSYALRVEKAHIVFGWPITILSICCCRVIMNMQTLRYADTDPERCSSRSTDTTIIMSEIDTLEVEMLEYMYHSQADTVVNNTANSR